MGSHTSTCTPAVTALTERRRKWLYGFCSKIYMRSSKIHQTKCVFPSTSWLSECICGAGSPVSQQQRTRAGLGSLKETWWPDLKDKCLKFQVT